MYLTNLQCVELLTRQYPMQELSEYIDIIISIYKTYKRKFVTYRYDGTDPQIANVCALYQVLKTYNKHSLSDLQTLSLIVKKKVSLIQHSYDIQSSDDTINQELVRYLQKNQTDNTRSDINTQLGLDL